MMSSWSIALPGYGLVAAPGSIYQDRSLSKIFAERLDVRIHDDAKFPNGCARSVNLRCHHDADTRVITGTGGECWGGEGMQGPEKGDA